MSNYGAMMSEDTQNKEFYDRRKHLLVTRNESEDEISLYDLFAVLIRKKVTIMSTTLIVLLMCAVYLLIAPTIYQISIKLLPPLSSDLRMTNIDSGLDAKTVFSEVKTTLKQNQNWDSFVRQENELFGDDERDARAVLNPLKLESEKDFPGEHFLVQYESTERELTVVRLEKYLAYVKQHFVQSRLTEIRAKHKVQKNTLELDIKLLQQHEKLLREDQILKLENDLKIAKRLGIVQNIYSVKTQSLDAKSYMPKSLTVVSRDGGSADYLRGTRILAAELEQLKKRKSDDPFIGGLRNKQRELAKLSAIIYTPDAFQPFVVDGEISDPVKIKPKSRLVLVLGVVLGLILGIFTAFLAEFVQKARQETT